MRHLDDFFHPRLDDAGKILHGNFFGTLVSNARYGHNLVRTGLLSDRASELGLELFSLLRKNIQSLLDIVRDNVAAERNHRGMAYDVIIKDRDIGSAPADVDQANAGLFFVVAQGCEA